MNEKLYRPPLIPSDIQPKQIIGGNAALVESHFTKAIKAQSQEEYERAMKSFAENERKIISDIYAELREIGIWPRGIDKFGNIEFGIACRSNLQTYTESMPLIDRKNFHLSVKFKEVSPVTYQDKLAEDIYGG